MKSNVDDMGGGKREVEAPGWHNAWEKSIYLQGKHLNLYPHHNVVSFLMRQFPDPRQRQCVRVLEIGCGAGNNLWFAAREGFEVSGIDGSTSAISFAQHRFHHDGLSGEFVTGDFQALPWGNQSFDIVLDRQAVGHNRLATIESTLDEVHRVLKPGGLFFSMVYSDQHPEIHNGKNLGDNTYGNFETGYFKHCGVVHFFSREELVSVYGSRFGLRAMVHTCEQEFDSQSNAESSRTINGFWRIECVNNNGC